jgi:hypothetical protein
MGARHAQTFQALRPEILNRLVEVRTSIDQSYGDLSDNESREQFRDLLARMQGFLETGDRTSLRNYLSRSLALRTGAGASPESVVHAVVAVGDVVVQVARAELPNDDDSAAFLYEVTQFSFTAARLLVESMADELARLSRRRTVPPFGARR